MPSFLEQLIKTKLAEAKASKPSKARKTSPAQQRRSEREERLYRLNSPLWQEESYVMLVTHTHCRCGETHVSPAPHLFLRRYHPRYGVHEEAICMRPTVDLHKMQQDHRHVECEICPACFPQEAEPAGPLPQDQMCFDFSNITRVNFVTKQVEEAPHG